MNDNVGVGPHLKPWPKGAQYDRSLLERGDQRNVLDKYRYWTVEAIKQDLDEHRQPLEIAIENLQRDFNIGTIVRTANAFNIGKVHIVGKKQWNRRGAMVTDLYMNIVYHKTVEEFVDAVASKKIIAVDIVDDAQEISSVELPRDCVLVFGAEGPGLSAAMVSAADIVAKIEQSGSTRSLNVGVAAGIAMYEWARRHR